MNNLVSWFFRIVAILAGVAAIAVAVLTMNKVEDINKELSDKQASLDQVKVELEQSGNKLKTVEGQLSSAIVDHTKATEAMGKMRVELGQLKGQASSLQTEKGKLEEEVRNLKGAVSNLNKALLDEQTKVPDIDPVEFKIAQQRAEKFEKQVEKLKERLKELQSNPEDQPTPELMAKGTTQEDQPAGPEGIEAVILAARPELGLLVLDIGSDNGLVPNDVLKVNRGERLLARVRVGQLLGDRAVGFIMPGEGIPSLIEDNEVVRVVR